MDDRNREDLKKFREELVLCLRWKNIVILKIIRNRIKKISKLSIFKQSIVSRETNSIKSIF